MKKLTIIIVLTLLLTPKISFAEIEDFNTYLFYKQADTEDDISYTSDSVTYSSYETRRQDGFLSKDYGRDWFGDFEIHAKITVTYMQNFAGEHYIIGLSNTCDNGYSDWDDGLGISIYRNTSVKMTVNTRSGWSSDQVVSFAYSPPFTLYIKFWREGTTLFGEAYLDEAMTSKYGATGELEVDTSQYRCIYVHNSANITPNADRAISGEQGYVEIIANGGRTRGPVLVH